MSAALLRLGTDDDLRHRLGAGALDVGRQYDADLIAQRWVEIFEAALARRAGRPRFAALSDAPRPAPPRRPAYDATGRHPARPRGSAALSLAVACAEPGGDEWLVIPPHESGVADRGAADGRAGRFLEELAGGRRRRRTSRCATRRPTAGTSVAAPVAELAPRPAARPHVGGRAGAMADDAGAARRRVLGQGCTVEVEFWEEGVDGQLVAPRRNRYTQRLAPPRRRRP